MRCSSGASITLASVALTAALSSCASRQAPDIHGRWKAVNHYAETTQAIPLQQSYVLQPSPLDGTLKAMLTRWAKDLNATLSYTYPYDFTLHAPVTKIHTSNVQEAARLLTMIYAAQGISITAMQGQIVVRSAESPVIKESPASPPSIAN